MFSILMTLMIGIVVGQKVRVEIDPSFIAELRSLASSMKAALAIRTSTKTDRAEAIETLAGETVEPKKLKSRSLSAVAADT
jgi:hypothetical protein